ncbi:MAG: hypothetical protein ACI4WM_00115 [Erysipelotrichaceae bacterium]
MKIVINKDIKEKEFNKHWKFCVGSPHASYALRKDYHDQLKQVHDELGIERVRFHGIFNDDMHTFHKMKDFMPIPYGNKYEERNYHFIKTAYDNILNAGMKPFVELSFMPKHLARNKRRGVFFYKPYIAPPKDLNKWEAYIKDFINFLIYTYSKEEVESWYFEVWNEPDLKLPFFNGSKEDYFRMYETTVKAIKSIDEKIQTGGPSTSGSKWVNDLIEYCDKRNIPIDFISTHEYAGDPLGGLEGNEEDIKISMDLLAGVKYYKELDHDNLLDLYRRISRADDVLKNMNEDAMILYSEKAKNDAGRRPLFYTEWNMCASFGAEINDTSMQAAYMLHTILNTQKSIDGSSVWCFTDLFEELHPFPEEFHGGFGLLTKSGIKKPAYHLLEILNHMPEKYLDISSNEADVIGFKCDDGFKFIVGKTDFKNLYGSYTAEFDLEINQEPEKVTVKRIDSYNCNPKKIWEELDSINCPNDELIREIKERSKLTDEELQYFYRDGHLSFKSVVEINGLAFIEVFV